MSPDGSSSGSGIAVAARTVPATLGTETRGSIRLPAAAMNVTAVKPTFGLVSVAGGIPVSFPYDVVGPMARSAIDCAILLEVIAGRDPRDPATASTPERSRVKPSSRGGAKPLAHERIGVPIFPDGAVAPIGETALSRVVEELV